MSHIIAHRGKLPLRAVSLPSMDHPLFRAPWEKRHGPGPIAFSDRRRAADYRASISFVAVSILDDRCALPLPPPGEQTQRAEAGGEERECGLMSALQKRTSINCSAILAQFLIAVT